MSDFLEKYGDEMTVQEKETYNRIQSMRILYDRLQEEEEHLQKLNNKVGAEYILKIKEKVRRDINNLIFN